VLLGVVLLEQDQPRDAAAELEKGLALGGDRNLILVPLGQVYLQLLDPEAVRTKVIAPGTDPIVDAEFFCYTETLRCYWAIWATRPKAMRMLGSASHKMHARWSARREGRLRAVVMRRQTRKLPPQLMSIPSQKAPGH